MLLAALLFSPPSCSCSPSRVRRGLRQEGGRNRHWKRDERHRCLAAAPDRIRPGGVAPQEGFQSGDATVTDADADPGAREAHVEQARAEAGAEGWRQAALHRPARALASSVKMETPLNTETAKGRPELGGHDLRRRHGRHVRTVPGGAASSR